MGTRNTAPQRALPLWPLYVMFTAMPLWWLLGGLYLGWALLGMLLAVVLLSHGRVAWPPGSALWFVLVGLILVSATRLEKASGLLVYGLRLGFVLTALVVYLYVYTAARQGARWDRLFQPVLFFWLAMVALGWVGVLAPRLALTTPVEVLLPDGLAGQRMIRAVTHVHSTEFNPTGRNPYYRTAAPYPYTNNWGTGFALLVPCVLAYLSAVRTGPLRRVLMVSLPLALVPAFLTLNRGMFIGLGVGLVYLGLRALLRGDVRLIGTIAAGLAVAWVITLVVPVGDMIMNRVENTDSTRDRADLYRQTLDAVLRSPLLGYGAPRSADTTTGAEPLGTQGQVWLTMYSHGIPALLVLLALLVVLVRSTAVAVSAAGRWLSVVPVVALALAPFYGFTDMNLSVTFFAIGLAVAAVDGPVNRELPAAVPRPSPV
ncbi:O-antigen ligase family protein [Micromonospora rifamycinica]|uniref:O-antigen ligase family protein n=1 Tax=Micromonospora rifamycinica TaxID=291594 RepID=UPI002E2E4BC3|nr:O-antigen ligase family protein [Micromonospora rifamycinica]